MKEISNHIISLLSKRDEKAIDLIYDHYGANLYGYISKIVNDEQIAQDVLQNSLVKIWKNGNKYEPSKSKLFTWMMNICRNSAIDILRKRKRDLTVDIQNVDSNVYTYGFTQFNIDHIDLKEKVDALDTKYKDVIEALFFRGMTQKEAEEYLGIPLGTVKTRLKIAIRELTKIFKYKKDVLSLLLALTWMIK